jgi:hypothetical protein
MPPGDARDRRTPPDEDRRAARSRREVREHPLRARTAARLAARHVAQLTGRELEGVTSLERNDDGTWQVGVEVLELPRIPDTTDILALYTAELDEDGELLSYQRIRRYRRCESREE